MTTDSGRPSLEDFLRLWELDENLEGSDWTRFIADLEEFFGDGCQSCERCWAHR